MTLSLVDTSVWVEWFRGTDSPASRLVESLAEEPAAMLSLDPDIDFLVAADLYRAVLADGGAPRSMLDCLIAAVALRHDAVLVHRDRDYARIGTVAPRLLLLPVPPD